MPGYLKIAGNTYEIPVSEASISRDSGHTMVDTIGGRRVAQKTPGRRHRTWSIARDGVNPQVWGVLDAAANGLYGSGEATWTDPWATSTNALSLDESLMTQGWQVSGSHSVVNNPLALECGQIMAVNQARNGSMKYSDLWGGPAGANTTASPSVQETLVPGVFSNLGGVGDYHALIANAISGGGLFPSYRVLVKGGESLGISFDVASVEATATVTIEVKYYYSATGGSLVGTHTSDPISAGGLGGASVNFVAPPRVNPSNDIYAEISVATSGVGGFLFRKVIFTSGLTTTDTILKMHRFFDGDSPDSGSVRYVWDGVAGASSSTRYMASAHQVVAPTQLVGSTQPVSIDLDIPSGIFSFSVWLRGSGIEMFIDYGFQELTLHEPVGPAGSDGWALYRVVDVVPQYSTVYITIENATGVAAPQLTLCQGAPKGWAPGQRGQVVLTDHNHSPITAVPEMAMTRDYVILEEIGLA